MSVGRNDPCPCGSGRKYKHCCLDIKRHDPAASPAEQSIRLLNRAIAGKKFGSLDEIQSFTDSYFQQRNLAPRESFLGLSAEEMFHFLNHPFDSPHLISFPARLDTSPEAPILTLFYLLVEAVGEKGLKATAKGNLPRKFCRDAALAYWGDEGYREKTRFGGINKEADFLDLNTTRLIAGMAGLILRRKGKFTVTRKCRDLLAKSGSGEVFPLLFRAYAKEFNWAYGDYFPDFHIIQQSFVFTLFLLSRFGDVERPQTFYEDCFLRAFPRVIDDVERGDYLPPKVQVRNCYTYRALKHFAHFLGLASVEPEKPEKRYDRNFRVRNLPLLDHVIHFHLPERAWPSVEDMVRKPRRIKDTKKDPSAKKTVFQFKVTLQDTEPPVWRRILIAGDATFSDLHSAIQDAMGWTGLHLHEFEIFNPALNRPESVGIPAEEFDEDQEVVPGWEVPLASRFKAANTQALYIYDFGDGWEHTVLLEKKLPRDPDVEYPACLDGGRKCPPEDCGGPHGYRNFLEIITDPAHPEHDECLDWVGGSFDPDEFNPQAIQFEDPQERLSALDEEW